MRQNSKNLEKIGEELKDEMSLKLQRNRNTLHLSLKTNQKQVDRVKIKNVLLQMFLCRVLRLKETFACEVDNGRLKIISNFTFNNI